MELTEPSEELADDDSVLSNGVFKIWEGSTKDWSLWSQVMERTPIPADLVEKASAMVEAIIADPENLWAVSAYGGVSVLLV